MVRRKAACSLQRHGIIHRHAMAHAEFEVSVSSDRLLRHYQGAATSIVVVTTTGTTLQLPAVAFRKFVTEAGLHGRFSVEYSERRRLKSLQRL